jgi:hypothetical protein
VGFVPHPREPWRGGQHLALDVHKGQRLPWVDHHRVRPRRARASELAPVDALDRDGVGSAVYLFRMMSGLMQIAGGAQTTLPVISGTIADGVNALTIILVMSFGLIIPKMIVDYLSNRSTQASG